MSDRREATARGPGFAEAIAQWRLHLRTELKRASSLPSSMFDACDPMLETRLCETAESMLSRLPNPAAAVTSPQQAGEQRIEAVGPDELRRLPSWLADGGAPTPTLDDGLATEYPAILADLATRADGPASQRAARLLATDCGLGRDADLDAAARLLWRLLPRGAEPMPGTDDQLADLCRRIAATVLAEAAAPPGGAEHA